MVPLSYPSDVHTILARVLLQEVGQMVTHSEDKERKYSTTPRLANTVPVNLTLLADTALKDRNYKHLNLQ